MNEAIRRSIEGGYRGNSIYINPITEEWLYNTDYPKSDLLLDTLFWQALGKAEGWDMQINTAGTRATPMYSNWVPYSWGWYWHNFIDHIASGGDIDTFFTNLLSKRK